MKYIIPLLLLVTLSCEDQIVCDASLRYNTVYSPDTLEYYEVIDIDRDSVIYSDSNVIGDLPVIDDSYLSVIGRNSTVGLNIRYIPVNSDLHVIGFCGLSDNCHIYTPHTLDTLVIQ